jgi:hypothetical protein
MALEGRNIGSGGIGSGQAQVYSQTQNAVNVYARTIAQQQAKREAEQKALADKLSQFSTEGLREVDKEGFYQVYDGWKNKTYDAMKAKDPKEKFRLQAEAEKDRQKAAKYVFDSKAKTQRDLAVGAKVLGKPHFFSEQGKQLYNKSLSAPIYSKDDIVDYSTIPLGYDKSKVVENITKLNNELLKQGKYDEVEGVTKKVGDLTVAEFKKIKRVDPKSQYSAYEMLYRGDDGFKAMVEETYPQLDWDNNEPQAIQMALTDMVTNAPLVKDEGLERRTVPNRDMTDYQKLSLALRQANAESEGSGGGIEQPQDITLYYGQDGKEAVTSRGTVKLGKTAQPMQGSVVYDLVENKFVPIKESASKYEIVSIGNYPLAKAEVKSKDGKLVIPKGGLVGNKFANSRPDLVTWTPRMLVTDGSYEYLADPKVLPKNKLTKKDESILATFKPMSQPATNKKVEDLRTKYKY